jgi:hypothetical protein
MIKVSSYLKVMRYNESLIPEILTHSHIIAFSLVPISDSGVIIHVLLEE